MSDETDQLVEDLVYAGRVLERLDDPRLKPLSHDNVRQYSAAVERIYREKRRLGKNCEHKWMPCSYQARETPAAEYKVRLGQSCALCSEVRWNDEKPAMQPVSNPDELPEYSQGVCGDGVAILCDGQMITVDEIVAALNASVGQPHRARAPDVVREVLAELANATAKFPMWPTDPLHAVGVVNEEVGELSKAVLQQVYEPHKNQPGDVRKEAVQAAAMTIRFLQSMDDYWFRPSSQHRQGSY